MLVIMIRNTYVNLYSIAVLIVQLSIAGLSRLYGVEPRSEGEKKFSGEERVSRGG